MKRRQFKKILRRALGMDKRSRRRRLRVERAMVKVVRRQPLRTIEAMR